ncbi:MAG: L,D-transpeptidase [Cyanobacteria bacterium P01_A01_bin.114]
MSKTICYGMMGLTAPLAASLLALPGAAQTTPQLLEAVPAEIVPAEAAPAAGVATPTSVSVADASIEPLASAPVAPSTVSPAIADSPEPLPRLLPSSKPVAKPEAAEPLASAPSAASTAVPAAPAATPAVAPTVAEPVASLPRLLQGVEPITDPNLLERLTATPTAAPPVLSPTVSPSLAEPQLSPLLPSPFSAGQQDDKLAAKPDLTERWAFPVPIESAEQSVQLVLRLEERQLYVYRGDTLETTFPVAVGRAGWETPTGSFEVSSMVENPGWTNPFTDEVVSPGPENPLGERWIAFWTDGQYEIGFHGTPNRESVGKAASHGCVRLYNEDVRALYDMVSPGTLVTVLP